jgi:serpin B
MRTGDHDSGQRRPVPGRLRGHRFRLAVILWLLSAGPGGLSAFAGDPMHTEPLVSDNSAFAADLFHALGDTAGNLFFSPYSVSSALAMTLAGARGDTAVQMKRTLRFSLDGKDLHAAFAAVQSRLNRLQDAGGNELHIANSLWTQKDSAFLDAYLTLVEAHYGAVITPVDYRQATEEARTSINSWVEDKTRGRISDLIQPGLLNALTRLVLVNAIYFKGQWQHPFTAALTTEAVFHVAPGKTAAVEMMAQRQSLRYAERDRIQILELPYADNQMSMVVLLPIDRDGLGRLEKRLTQQAIRRWQAALRPQEVHVFLPKFEMQATYRLDRVLKAMGMVDAFSDTRANFAGMDGRPDWLFIDAAVHKAFVDVSETGTEAAAATAVVMAGRAMPAPVPTFRANHPFVFLIRDNRTGSILFMGRMADPSAGG